MNENIPDDIIKALGEDGEAKTLFEALPPSHQREYVRWIDEAKKQSTRVGRITRMISMLKGLVK